MPLGSTIEQIELAVTLMIVIWVATIALSVPCHEKLSLGFDASAHRRLVLTNWIRTIAWTLRGLLILGASRV